MISRFVGLGDQAFIVSVSSQKEGVAGHIELEHGAPGVFIEISEAAREFENAIPAILAHEIAHKYLHVHDVYVSLPYSSELEVEVLTDITAVFLGLGKLLLNGRHLSRETKHEKGETVVETYDCGYLDRAQVAMAYTLVCSMRQIPAAQYESGLTGDVIGYLRDYRQRYQYCGAYADYGDEELRDRIGVLLLKAQLKLADIERALTVIREGYVADTEAFLRSAHMQLKCLLGEVDRRTTEVDPCMRRLRAMSLARALQHVDCSSSEATQRRHLSLALVR